MMTGQADIKMCKSDDTNMTKVKLKVDIVEIHAIVKMILKSLSKKMLSICEHYSKLSRRQSVGWAAVKRHPCQMFTQPASKARNRQKALLNPINQIFKSNVPEINQRNFLIDFLKINVIGSKSSIGF